MCAGCFRIAENNKRPPGLVLLLSMSVATISNEITGHYLQPGTWLNLCFTCVLYKCELCYHTCTPRAETHTHWRGGQEFCWKFLGEVTQFLCASAALLTFFWDGSTWIPNVSLLTYSQQQDFQRHFFPFQLRQDANISFPSFTYA